METVNDLHGDLVNLARVVQDAVLGPALYRRLRRVLFAKPLFQSAASRMRALPVLPAESRPDPDRAFWFWIVSWMGRNGVAGTPGYNRNFCARFTHGGGNPADRFAGAVDSIPAFRRRLRRVAIYRMDAFDLLASIADEKGTVIYCDPPYVEKGFRYKHDFEEADHRRLAEALGRFKRTRVVVSYYKHPLLNSLYLEWTRRDLECLRRLGLASGRGSRASDAPEVLLINGPSLAKQHEPSLLEAFPDA
jgi:DNA adenine methylase